MAKNLNRRLFLFFFGHFIVAAHGAPLYKRADDSASTWQVLASGTQDLAALVGLFATDSVERYSADYSRGYLGAAMAPISMLGILGYVRALIKLAMGREACVSASFPTAPVRALLGVPDEDRLPGDELVTVTYVKRYREGENIIWKKVKSVAHTKESMPATWAHTAAGRERKPQFLLLEAGRDSKKAFSQQTPPRQFGVVLAILVSAGVNSFAVFLIGGGWPWSKFVASIVTFCFVASSSLMWAFVYMREQVPLFSNNSTLRLAKEGENHKLTCGTVSLCTSGRDISFSLMESAGSYVLLPCSALTHRELAYARVFSGVSAGLITLGYICQYIVVRRSTQNESLRWLLIQAGLTCVRLLVWVFPPRMIPSCFDQHNNFQYGHLPRPSFSDFQASSGVLFGSAFEDYQTFTELELAVTFPSAGVGLEEIVIPEAVMLALCKVDIASSLDHVLRLEPAWVDRVKKALRGTALRWRIDPLLFRKLLLQRSANVELASIELSDERVVADWTCLLLDLAAGDSWAKSDPVLVPLIRLTYRIDLLNRKGRQVARPQVLTSFCTCLSPDDPGVNLIEFDVAEKACWLPFNELFPVFSGFPSARPTHFRVVFETGEAGDASIDSELTMDGYTKRWPPFRKKIEEATALRVNSKRNGPERTMIQFFKESRLMDETIRPEVVVKTFK